jgi:hypothetical protein
MESCSASRVQLRIFYQLERPVMIERRAFERVQLNQLALLSFRGISGVHPCLVRNLHMCGAGLYSNSFHFFANDFLMSFDGFKSSTHCHVVWRRGYECGVLFPAGYLHSEREISSIPA